MVDPPTLSPALATELGWTATYVLVTPTLGTLDCSGYPEHTQQEKGRVFLSYLICNEPHRVQYFPGNST